MFTVELLINTDIWFLDALKIKKDANNMGSGLKNMSWQKVKPDPKHQTVNELIRKIVEILNESKMQSLAGQTKVNGQTWTCLILPTYFDNLPRD